MSNSKDQIYLHEQIHQEFVFDETVASVFSDMIERSVPGYATIISMIGMLAEQYQQANARFYDLGCSLGAGSIAMQHHISKQGCEIIAIDNSAAMIERCSAVINNKSVANASSPETPVVLQCADINEVDIENACMVVLNFTLQFISLEQRLALLRKIYSGLRPGGLLVLSEKIQFEDEALDKVFIDLHHRFKMKNGYTELEVSRKRAAIENVLIPETISDHEKRIAEAGFSSFDVWFQGINFASMVAVKGNE